MKLDRTKIENILVIKFGGIGDILLTTPVFPNLRAYFPDAVINLLTLRHSRDILIDNPYLTRAFTYDPSEDKSWCLIRNMRSQKYDLVIDLFGNPRTAFITFMTGARYRFGFEFRGRKYAYNLSSKGRGGEVHNVEFNLDALRALEIPIISRSLCLPINIVHKEFADDFVNKAGIGNRFIIGISKTGGWESKRYKSDDYIDLINRINRKYDASFMLFWGTKKEKQDCEYIAETITDRNAVVIPDSPIKYLGALIRKCRLVIGNDSGPLHIAVSVGTPTLGIYGPTNPQLQGPYGDKNESIVSEDLKCLYCNLLECDIGNICMTQLSKDHIIEKMEHLAEKNSISIPAK